MIRQYHGLNEHEFEPIPEITEDKAAWHATIHGYAKRPELVIKQTHYNNAAKSFRQRANLTQNFKIRTKLTQNLTA